MPMASLFPRLPSEPPLDLSSRRRLLESMASRGSSEVAALVIPGFLVWAMSRYGSVASMLAWWAGFGLFTLVLIDRRRRFRADLAVRGDAAADRWEPVFQRLAVLNGLCWTMPVFLTLRVPSYEFKLLLYLVIAAVIASAATFLAPLPGVFFRFFAACFGPLVVAVVWMFPNRWPFILPLTLLYGVVICRHAWGTRGFVRQQLALERERAELAERYRGARDRAEHALAEKDRFLSTASHDLRQPVHAMGMLVEAALARNHDEGLAPVLQDVRRAARSLTGMFDALLDLSRIEAGTSAASRVAVPVRELFDDAATVFGGDAAARGLVVRRHLPRRHEAAVAGDPTLVRQVVFNLLQNALRYTQRGGVLLGVRSRADQWRIEVWDTGSGVAAEDRGRIYSPFFRGPQARSRVTTGHGLGLAVVARSAELMSAGYGFSSEPGRGSCFWIELPKTEAVPLPATSGVYGRVRSLAGRCLLVEDDPQVGPAWVGLLATWGATARLARDRAQALQCLDAGFDPDVILCDQRLASGDSGFDVLKTLLARCPRAHGAMVSGELDTPELTEAEDEGYLVFRKPVEPGVLHAVLSRWLPTTLPSGDSGPAA